MNNRTICITQKIDTEFGKMYAHVDFTPDGRPVGGSISWPRKEPEAQITRLIDTLSAGLNGALAALGEAVDG